jgi:hypothetical protein
LAGKYSSKYLFYLTKIVLFFVTEIRLFTVFIAHKQKSLFLQNNVEIRRRREHKQFAFQIFFPFSPQPKTFPCFHTLTPNALQLSMASTMERDR